MTNFTPILSPALAAQYSDASSASRALAAAEIQALTKAFASSTQSFETILMGQLSFSPQSISHSTPQVNTNSVSMNALAQLFIPMAVQGVSSQAKDNGNQNRHKKRDDQGGKNSKESPPAPAKLL